MESFARIVKARRLDSTRPGASSLWCCGTPLAKVNKINAAATVRGVRLGHLVVVEGRSLGLGNKAESVAEIPQLPAATATARTRPGTSSGVAGTTLRCLFGEQAVEELNSPLRISSLPRTFRPKRRITDRFQGRKESVQDSYPCPMPARIKTRCPQSARGSAKAKHVGHCV